MNKIIDFVSNYFEIIFGTLFWMTIILGYLIAGQLEYANWMVELFSKSVMPPIISLIIILSAAGFSKFLKTRR